MKKLTIKRDNDVVAMLEGTRLEVADIGSVDGAMVYQLVSHGVPVERGNPDVEYEFWRVQVSDPDYVETLTRHLASYGMTVEHA